MNQQQNTETKKKQLRKEDICYGYIFPKELSLDASHANSDKNIGFYANFDVDIQIMRRIGLNLGQHTAKHISK